MRWDRAGGSGPPSPSRSGHRRRARLRPAWQRRRSTRPTRCRMRRTCRPARHADQPAQQTRPPRRPDNRALVARRAGRRPGHRDGTGAAGVRPGGRVHTQDRRPFDFGRARTRLEGSDGGPEDPAVAGWFSRGPAPGALGPAVIAGHVTWNGAPGVFYRLGKLRRGDRVAVTREDGIDRRLRRQPGGPLLKERFPIRKVFGTIDHAGLRLITCGGRYDPSHHRYPDNVVVFARLESVRSPDR